MSQCTSCGAEIIWVKTNTGKKMPVDWTPSKCGNLRLERLTGGAWVAHVEPAPAAGLHTSHFVTCPHAAAHRRPRKP